MGTNYLCNEGKKCKKNKLGCDQKLVHIYVHGAVVGGMENRVGEDFYTVNSHMGFMLQVTASCEESLSSSIAAPTQGGQREGWGKEEAGHSCACRVRSSRLGSLKSVLVFSCSLPNLVTSEERHLLTVVLWRI